METFAGPAEHDEELEDTVKSKERDSGFVEELKTLTSGTTLKRKKTPEVTRYTTTRDISREASSHRRTSKEEEAGDEREKILALLNQVDRKVLRSRGDGGDPPRDRGRSRSKKAQEAREKAIRLQVQQQKASKHR